MKVGELIRLLEEDGWRLVRTRGSHRQYKNANKPGTVTVAELGRAAGHAERGPEAGRPEEGRE